MSKVDSVKDRLKNIAVKNKRSMQDMLIAYGLERTIYRLSVSRYADKFTLKGGIFLYALFDGNYARVTTDIDLLGQDIGNNVSDLEKIFAEIFRINADDPIIFDIGSLKAESITEFKKYHGVKITVMGYLDRTKIPVSIDIGFGDVIYPNRQLIDFPTVLSEEKPRIYCYSVVSSVAEKFEAIVSLAYNNSRFKDFYDIYILSLEYDFNGDELREAVKETFGYRNTSLDDIAAFEETFAVDEVRRARWKAFVKKKKPLVDVTFEEVMGQVKIFLNPVAESVSYGKSFSLIWDHENKKWK